MSINNNKIKLSNFLIPLNMYKNDDRKVAYDDNDAAASSVCDRKSCNFFAKHVCYHVMG